MPRAAAVSRINRRIESFITVKDVYRDRKLIQPIRPALESLINNKLQEPAKTLGVCEQLATQGTLQLFPDGLHFRFTPSGR